MTGVTSPDQLRAVLSDGGEFALLDVRERGQYARAHLFLAINLPLSQLELRMRQYVPRRSTRVFLCDRNDGYADRARVVMEAAGYSRVSVIDGGVDNCVAAGFALFRGHYTVTYTFGLLVAQKLGTPEISAETLNTMRNEHEPLVLLDSRNPDEFHDTSIPGAINVPLGELAYRLRDLAPDPDTHVVVNCGAVTRGILGGQSLIDAGAVNRVSVLTNGVRGWDVAGFDLNHGVSTPPPAITPESASQAIDSAQHLDHLDQVQLVDMPTLRRWRDDPDRTLFLVDVRTRQEYLAGHLADSVWILGGELIGLYEDHIGTRNARICLVDNDGARARLTACWLVRLGWPDVSVLTDDLAGAVLTTGPEVRSIPEIEQTDVTRRTASDLAVDLDSGHTLVLDFSTSSNYAHSHIPGAWWLLRSSLPTLADKLPGVDQIVTTCADGRLATLAAVDLSELVDTPVAVLSGGTAAWIEAGFPTVSGLTRTLGEIEDVATEFVIRPDDDVTTRRLAQRRMLRWQEELLDTLARDQTYAFPPL